MLTNCITSVNVVQMNKPLSYGKRESVAGDPGAKGIAGGNEGGGAKGQAQCVGSGSVGCGVGNKPFKPEGTSITLWSAGRKDGSDINNSMGLVEAYRMMLCL